MAILADANRRLVRVGQAGNIGKMSSRANMRYGEAVPFGGLMQNWVILYTPTGAEEKVVKRLKQKLSPDVYLPFIPYRETPFRRQGITHKDKTILFPGYVFVQTEIGAEMLAEQLYLDIQMSGAKADIYRILHYGDNKKDVALREYERQEWSRFFGDAFVVEGSVGFIAGDQIRITSGSLMGMESCIRKINRHKREAIVEIDIMGAKREVRLMLEIVEKI